jgi:uncharacterized membrane protein (DUF106 family)
MKITLEEIKKRWKAASPPFWKEVRKYAKILWIGALTILSPLGADQILETFGLNLSVEQMYPEWFLTALRNAAAIGASVHLMTKFTIDDNPIPETVKDKIVERQKEAIEIQEEAIEIQKEALNDQNKVD